MVFTLPVFLSTPSAQGVFWKLFSTLCFVIATTLVVQMSKTGNTLSPFQIAFFQAALPWAILQSFSVMTRSRRQGGNPEKTQMTCFVRALPFLTMTPFKNTLLTPDPKNALLRALCACIGFVAWFWSLKFLPLGLSGFFRLLGPLVTFGAALLFLRERTSLTHIMALLGTLVGAAFLMSQELLSGSWHLQAHLTPLSLTLPFIAILGFAGANIFGKRLLQHVSPHQATLSLLALNSLLLSIGALPVWSWPSGPQWKLLLLMGAIDAAAQWSLNRALSLTQLSLLVPISLWRFALMALSGMLFFGEPFRFSLWFGVLLIALMTGVIVRKG